MTAAGLRLVEFATLERTRHTSYRLTVATPAKGRRRCRVTALVRTCYPLARIRRIDSTE